jgi:uncharacterized protein (DUF58 family)
LNTASTQNAFSWSERGQSASQALPPLLVKAEKVAATIILGVHGRKRSGPGESFWQYRPYSFGDSTQRIDWRRSALADRVYIRETEWEAANTLWVWTGASARMNFKSKLAEETKAHRAQLLGLALASLSVRAHERVGGLGSSRQAGYGKGALLRLAEWIISARGDELPKPQRLQKQSAAALISDFLEPLDDISRAMKPMAEAGIRGHMVQIADPIEETFPFEGRIEFVGLDGPARYLAPKTQSIKEAYQEKYSLHREGLKALARQLGWSFTVHRTDQSVTKVLMALHAQIGGLESDTRAKGNA